MRKQFNNEKLVFFCWVFVKVTVSQYMYKLKHFYTLKSMACLRSLSSLNEYLASPVTASTGPFSDCCLTALNNINNGSPASF